MGQQLVILVKSYNDKMQNVTNNLLEMRTGYIFTQMKYGAFLEIENMCLFLQKSHDSILGIISLLKAHFPEVDTRKNFSLFR